MIKKIRLKNFVSHKDSELELDPGLNVIAGSTGNGKSVIHEGLEWALLNNFRGLGFRPTTYPVDKKDSSSVGVIFDNGSVIRERNERTDEENKINGYRFSNGNKSGKLEALRTDVPKEIFDISRIDEINIQGQEDDRFLLSKHTSPGEVAKKLNEFCGLTIIDEVLDRARSNVDSVNKELVRTQKDLEESEKEVKKLSYLDSIEPLFIEIDGLVIKNSELKSKVIKVKELSGKTSELRERIIDNKDWLKCRLILSEIETLVDTKYTLSLKIVDIKTLSKRAQFLKESIQKKQKFLDAKVVLSDIEMLIDKRGMIVSLKDKVKNVSEQVSKLRTKIHNNQEIIKNKNSELKNLLDSVKLCPIFEVNCPLSDSVKSGKVTF